MLPVLENLPRAVQFLLNMTEHVISKTSNILV